MPLKESEGCSLEVMSLMQLGLCSLLCLKNLKTRRLLQSSTPMVVEDRLEHITLLQGTMLDGEILVMKTNKWQSSPMIKSIHY